jgi:hypothetical protein
MTVDQQFNSINEKLQLLLRQHARLKKENEALRLRLESEQESRKALEEGVTELQNVVTIMKLAAGNLNDREKKDFEKQINRYVKEIDRCIALLSE